MKTAATIEAVAKRVATPASENHGGKAWLSDMAREMGMSTRDVAEIARARGMRLCRFDLVGALENDPVAWARLAASEVTFWHNATVHYVEVL